MSQPGYILVTLHFYREGAQWVGECPELGTSTCGDTLDETVEALREAISLNLEGLVEAGECERFFKKWGITVYREIPKYSVNSRERPVSFLDEESLTDERIISVAC